MTEDSDSLPLDGEAELTPAERLMVRRMIREEERASWARRKLKVIVPAAVAIVVALWQVIDWARAHIAWK